MNEPLPLAFHESLDDKNRNKPQCEGYTSKELLIQNGCKLLPFQIKSDKLTVGIAKSDITIALYKSVDDSLVADLTSLTTDIQADLSLDKDVSYVLNGTTVSNSYLTYLGTINMIDSGSCIFDGDCEYYVIVTDTGSAFPNTFGTFYSEDFRVAQSGEELVKLTFTNSADFLGRVLYQNGYTNTMYLDIDVKEPLYPVTEVGEENGDKQFIPTFTKWEKTFSFTSYFPEYLADVLTTLPLYDDVNITFKNGNEYKIKDISVSVDWQDLGETEKSSGCFAEVTVTFAIDSIIVTTCGDDMTIN